MENICCIFHFTEKKQTKAFKINEIRCFVMQSDKEDYQGEKGVRECIERTVTAG